jgi:cell division protein FtsI (penicillin-binding protein 3)
LTIQDPKGAHYGGSLAGPVFKKVMTFVLQSEHVAPTGTKVMPVALTQSELVKKQSQSTVIQAKQASAKKP